MSSSKELIEYLHAKVLGRIASVKGREEARNDIIALTNKHWPKPITVEQLEKAYWAAIKKSPNKHRRRPLLKSEKSILKAITKELNNEK